MEEESTATTSPEAQKVAAIKRKLAPEVTARLKDAADLMTEIKVLFTNEGVKADAEYYEKQAERIQKMAGWYDPAAKKQSKIERMRAALARLEAEAEAERAGRASA